MTLGAVWHALGFRNPAKLSKRELQSYVIWGPVVFVVAGVEILGAASGWLERHLHWNIHDVVRWPTISSTVGHLETRWPAVAALVVAVVVALILVVRRKREQLMVRPEPDAQRFSPWGLAYDVGALAVVAVASFAVSQTDATKYQLGYTIYGLLLMLLVLAPSVWALASPNDEPSLVSAIRSLEHRVVWLNGLLVCGLSVLVLHLALYPWPDLPRGR